MTTSCGEPVGAVVAKAAVAAGPPAEQAMQRRGAEREQLVADGGLERQRAGLGVHGLLQPRRRLARRRRQRDERRGLAARGGLLGEQRDDPRDGRRLAGARAAGDDREAAQRRGRGGEPLALVAVAGEQALEARREHAGVHARRLGLAERAQVGGDLALLAPVAIEVQAAARQPQRPARRVVVLAVGDERAAPQRRRPGRTSGHGSSGSATGSSASSDVACSAIVARST